jgi:hypothetical protein
MDTEAFWRVLDAAKDSGKPLDVAVVDHLSALPAEEIIAFEDRFCRLRDAVYSGRRTIEPVDGGLELVGARPGLGEGGIGLAQGA